MSFSLNDDKPYDSVERLILAMDIGTTNSKLELGLVFLPGSMFSSGGLVHSCVSRAENRSQNGAMNVIDLPVLTMSTGRKMAGSRGGGRRFQGELAVLLRVKFADISRYRR